MRELFDAYDPRQFSAQAAHLVAVSGQLFFLDQQLGGGLNPLLLSDYFVVNDIDMRAHSFLLERDYIIGVCAQP